MFGGQWFGWTYVVKKECLKYIETKASGSWLECINICILPFSIEMLYQFACTNSREIACWNKLYTLFSVGDLLILWNYPWFFFNPNPTFHFWRVNICHLLGTSTDIKWNRESKSSFKWNFPKEKDFETIYTNVSFRLQQIIQNWW